MTEPVAWRYKMSEREAWQYLACKPSENFHWRYVDPLYTAEQLHPRVRMTEKQYDRLMWDKSHTNLLTCLDYFFIHDDNYKFGLPSENLKGVLTQEDIALAWLNPEETIEIFPDMKWFVARNDTSDDHRFLSKNVINLDNELNYAALKKSAKQFDTKEEAEKWTNPLTEAVQLPVEDE